MLKRERERRRVVEDDKEGGEERDELRMEKKRGIQALVKDKLMAVLKIAAN